MLPHFFLERLREIKQQFRSYYPSQHGLSIRRLSCFTITIFLYCDRKRVGSRHSLFFRQFSSNHPWESKLNLLAYLRTCWQATPVSISSKSMANRGLCSELDKSPLGFRFSWSYMTERSLFVWEKQDGWKKPIVNGTRFTGRLYPCCSNREISWFPNNGWGSGKNWLHKICIIKTT